MSKAFTREDDGAGFDEPRPSSVTAALLAPVIARAVEVRPAAGGPTRVVRVLAAGEPGSVVGGCSAASPLGRALVHAAVGDVVEVASPRGREELEIVAILPASVSLPSNG